MKVRCKNQKKAETRPVNEKSENSIMLTRLNQSSYRHFILTFLSVWLGSTGFSYEAQSRRTIEKLEATINSDVILQSDIRQFKKTLELRKQLDPLFGSTEMSKKGKSASDQSIVDFLLNEKLILQKFPVSDEEVEKEIKSIQATNSISRENLIQALSAQGFSFKNYFELIRPSIAKRNLIDREIRTKVHISKDDIKNYFYNQFKEKDAQNYSYRIGLMTLSTATHSTLVDAKKAAEKAVELIQAGTDFKEAAKRFSDDGNSESGGDLGFLRFGFV